MQILDTQIISYAFKGSSDFRVAENFISSVTANEYLGAHSSHPARANYYLPKANSVLAMPGRLMSSIESYRKHFNNHPFRRLDTDQLILDFNNDFPTTIEFGSLAVTALINNKGAWLFDNAIRTFDKSKQKLLRRRLSFLLDNDIKCVPLTKQSAELGIRLLSSFSERYSLKNKFRNSLNDILILATAMHRGAKLVTKDSVLARFTAEESLVAIHAHGDHVVLDFCSPEIGTRRESRESKGFVNRRWSVMAKRYGDHRVV